MLLFLLLFPSCRSWFSLPFLSRGVVSFLPSSFSSSSSRSRSFASLLPLSLLFPLLLFLPPLPSPSSPDKRPSERPSSVIHWLCWTTDARPLSAPRKKEGRKPSLLASSCKNLQLGRIVEKKTGLFGKGRGSLYSQRAKIYRLFRSHLRNYFADSSSGGEKSELLRQLPTAFNVVREGKAIVSSVLLRDFDLFFFRSGLSFQNVKDYSEKTAARSVPSAFGGRTEATAPAEVEEAVEPATALITLTKRGRRALGQVTHCVAGGIEERKELFHPSQENRRKAEFAGGTFF